MTISKINFCTDLLLEHFKPSGPINQLNQTTNFKNRPFVQASIVEGFTIDSQSRIRVNLKGIVIAPTSDTVNRESFSFECFDINCFESTLEETRTPISKICKQTIQITSITEETRPGVFETTETTIPLRNPLAEPEIHKKPARGSFTLNVPTIEIKTRALNFETLDSQTHCDLDSEEFPIYYARGEKDIKGNMYFADFGYIDPLTEDFITIQRNVSFSLAPLDNVLTSISTEIAPREVKAVQIKRLRQGVLETIGIVYGQLPDQFYFPHQDIKFNRQFNDQDINLEDLSINLLLYTNIKSNLEVENRITFKNKHYSTPEIEYVIQNSFRVLSQLPNSDADSPQLYSTPSTFKSFTKEDRDYNYLADNNYLLEEIKCFEDTCFEDTCFKIFKNNNLVDRSIKNRAIAWAIISFSSYIVNYNNEDYKQYVINSITYLLNQKNSIGLFYSGWNQTKLRGTYNSSLELDLTIDTSTNIVILLALLKSFELTQDFKYIVEASLLYDNINKYLRTPSNTFKHNLESDQESIESNVYGLMYLTVFKDYNTAYSILDFLSSNLFYESEAPSVLKVVRDQQNVITNLDNVIIDNQTINKDYSQIFNPTKLDNYTPGIETLKINYLAYSSVLLLSNSINIPFLTNLTKTLNLVETRLIDNRFEFSSLYCAACITNNQSIVNSDTNKFNSLVDFNNYRFSKDLLFNKALKAIPINYSWVDPKVLNKNSNIGSLLYAVTSSQALNTAKKEFVKRMASISYMYGVILNRKARDVQLERIPKEKEEELKERIKIELTSTGNTKLDIEKKLEFYDTKIVIKDNYLLIQSFSGEGDSNFTTNWGEGFLSGTKLATTVKYTINVYQPLEEDALELINRLVPVGINNKFNEIIRFKIGAKNCGVKNFLRGSQEGCIGFRMTGEDIGCSNIDLETADNLANENRGKICREDEETTVSVPEPEKCDGVLTNNQEVIITSSNNRICITRIS